MLLPPHAETGFALLPDASAKDLFFDFEGNPFWDHEAQAVYSKGWKGHLDEWNRFGSDHPYHYLGSAKTNCQIGRAFGDAMIELCRSGAKR